MLTHTLLPGVALRLLEERDAPELDAVVEANREYLARWMPWAADNTEQDTLDYIRRVRKQLADNDGLTTAITVDGRIAGSVGMVSVSWRDLSTEIGYWLAAEHQGRGIMTAAVRAYLDYAFDTLELNRVGVKAAIKNARSRAVPERLGFTYEGTEREAERLGGRAHDLASYSMLNTEWVRTRPAG